MATVGESYRSLHDCLHCCSSDLFFFNDPATTEIYTLSLHDALPICAGAVRRGDHDRCADQEPRPAGRDDPHTGHDRSEEHTSELQSHVNLVCRLLLEKKKKQTKYNT